ncbi:MAG: bifunctional phosphoribosyl-AMP cyclohydrolase/phosphoribosyl-ATP diphosphatase HisIE [Bacillota bacterium]|nr:bifunctional phosphoribosyl-AMP cyclohydrolase/phosphoribosyl-ATP diphosphatase HisIE [Bacillota bacterium]
MKNKSIFACMDIKDGKVVKGVKFEDINVVSDDPVLLGQKYEKDGADYLVFYDIGATVDNKEIFYDKIEKILKSVNIPLVVGGGIRTLADCDRLYALGVRHFSINSAAVKNPGLLKEVSEKYGADSLILSVDAKKVGDKYHVFLGAGKEDTGLDAKEWIEKAAALGVGSVVINSIDTDGMKEGYDLQMLADLSENVSCGIVASGGAGKAEDFIEVFQNNKKVTGALAASIFHYDLVSIKEIKMKLEKITGIDIDSLKYDERGLIPAIVVDADSGAVLMLAYMNKESLALSMEKNLTHFYSRSRQALWLKGETSGNYQHIRKIVADCDLDALLIYVDKDGPACHTGAESCFFSTVYENAEKGDGFSLDNLYNLILDRKANPGEKSYTSYLFREGRDKILKKVGEESTEVVIAAKGDSKKETIYEMADLLYHNLVLMADMGIEIKDILNELKGRYKK